MIFIAALIGILIGILVNRGADNLPPPPRRSLLETPRCPYCDSPRAPLEQFGIAAFALRRDKCHQCGAPLRLRAPLVEIVTGALFAFLAARYSFNLYLVIICLFTAVLVLITVIDLEHKLILNVVVLPATLLALLTSPIVLGGPNVTLATWNWNRVVLSLLGLGVGYAMTLAIYFFGILFVRVINRNRKTKINTVAFGFGDVKLAGLLGALIGFPAIFYALIYAILLGGIGAVIALVLRSTQKGKYTAFTAIPYGPYLVLAGSAFLIFGNELLAWIIGP